MIEHEVTGWVDRLNWALSRVSMWIVAAIIAIMAYEVVMRYAFVRPTIWASELSLWLAGMVYLLAGLYAMQQRSHIRIFLLYDMAPFWLRKTFDVVSTLCLVLFCAAVVWGGYGEAKAKLLRWETFGTAFDPPIPATMKPLVLITVVILAVQAISNLIHDWHKPPESHDPADEFRKQAPGRADVADPTGSETVRGGAPPDPASAASEARADDGLGPAYRRPGERGDDDPPASPPDRPPRDGRG